MLSPFCDRVFQVGLEEWIGWPIRSAGEVSYSLRWQQPQHSFTTSSPSQDGSRYNYACLHLHFVGKLLEKTLEAPHNIVRWHLDILVLTLASQAEALRLSLPQR